MMGPLWGEFLAVPEEQLVVHQDGEEIWVGGLCIRAVDTPGHAEHHFSYLIDGDCFTGDIAGVRVGGAKLVRLPTPPPEFHPGKWRESLHKLARLKPARLLPTHFGAYTDPEWHIAAALRELEEIETWMERVMPSGPSIDHLHDEFSDWSLQRLKAEGIGPSLELAQDAVNPAVMSADGIARYWRKFKTIL
jgi:glyoxylase-like metal-dependent hydrolase (beta-lactamase superfamily II)